MTTIHRIYSYLSLNTSPPKKKGFNVQDEYHGVHKKTFFKKPIKNFLHQLWTYIKLNLFPPLISKKETAINTEVIICRTQSSNSSSMLERCNRKKKVRIPQIRESINMISRGFIIINFHAHPTPPGLEV